MVSETAQLQEERYSPFVRVTLRRWAKLYSGGAELFWPFTDLVTRLFIALPFLRSGLVKASDWDTAVLLATNEYPVSWMEPQTAAALGLTIELVGPLLLVLGLFTRPAAFAMATLTIIAQAVYVPTTTNLMLGAMLVWYVFHGSAAFSLDRMLAPGVKQSALPLARPAVMLGEFLSDRMAPIIMLLIRIWLGVALLDWADVFEPSIALATWLPTTIFTGIPDWIAITVAVLFFAGFAASVVSYILVFAIGIFMIAGVHPDVTFYPILLLAIYESRGAGILSLDQVVASWMERNILFDRDYADIPKEWPHIVIVGAGFGGLAAVNRLKALPVRITVIDKRNYHLFQPLLYQIATATLNPADIATPIRSLFKADGNVRVIKGEVKGVDTSAKKLIYGDDQVLEYDKLVLATGASHSYFGKDEWGEFAPGLKTVEDGVAVRASILEAFEQAEACDDPHQIERLMTFVIVGAGPTGVELAGAIAELAKHNVAREFRTIDPASARVILVQSGPRILPAFPDHLSEQAAKSLEKLGVEIRTESKVTEIAERFVRIGEDTILETETVLWAAGVTASPAARWLGVEADKSGRVVVDENLRIAGYDDVFAIGDTAGSNAWDGNPVPGLAPAAKQAGAYVAKVVEAELSGRPAPPPFEYRHKGNLATIGRKAAVADFGRVRISGALAWWLWGLVHVGFLTGARNRVTVAVNWAWSFFANHSGVRLITKS
ncbi:MAG: NAD(P)/FAD-dependent oxidoreductase [Pseudomonadota bacterium]